MSTIHVPRFESFIMAGFECTSALDIRRQRLDLLGATQHDVHVDTDYHLVCTAGMKTVREGLAWSQIDNAVGRYDFSRYIPMLEAAQRNGIQQIWDLNHFDFPSDLDAFSPQFVQRFGAYAQACVQLFRKYTTQTLYIAPLNEISFFSWIGADRGQWAPYTKGREKGFAFKTQLVKAAIAAMEKIWEVESNVRFIHIDPFMRRMAVEPATRTAKEQVKEFNEVIRYEAWDMLAGKSHPEVGGNSRYLDILGINYYIHNQEWVMPGGSKGKRLRYQFMDWESADRISLAQMLKEVYERYQRPLIVTETGSFGDNRYPWWVRTLAEIKDALSLGLPLSGVCAYPVLDRPDSAGFLLPQSGLWDFVQNDLQCQRIPYAKALEVITRFHVDI